MKLTIKSNISVVAAATLFGAGLEISQMTNPQKIIGFLNVLENWDPSLIFVMVGAILVNAILYKMIIKRKNPIFAPSFNLPTRKDIDAKLILGSALFGIGWGMGGFCPGPAIAGTFRGQSELIIVALSILTGIFSYGFLFDRSSQ